MRLHFATREPHCFHGGKNFYNSFFFPSFCISCLAEMKKKKSKEGSWACNDSVYNYNVYLFTMLKTAPTIMSCMPHHLTFTVSLTHKAANVQLFLVITHLRCQLRCLSHSKRDTWVVTRKGEKKKHFPS